MDEHDALSPEDLRTIAIACKLLPPDGAMTPALIEYTETIVGYCASIGEKYPDEDGNCGDEIRAAFGMG